ncbi:hypothetical protein F751_3500 [Auxenochlorella protothecoides]|nr:hypothetical protein F751_3500 [Auxenochlorella protothecoides]KFM28670.1 hypothetical protein F751_3500 [Auxenochlorella protothecoides]RMZ55567.1 hypothetical protein APUTEX25_000150 [Auxenochlorella protothecoides]|eukprot:RMZ55567.1 hypothetical protein APUTEX25_000150 [Auxenochlorella protothecoides]
MRRCPASHICAAAGAEPEITSSDTVPVSLRVTQHVSFGEVLKIAGQPHALGGWRLTHAPALRWSEGDVWTLDLDLPAGKHEYKLVIHNESADVAYWEQGNNRTFTVSEQCDAPLVLEFNSVEVITETADELNAVSDSQLSADEANPPTAAAEEPTAAKAGSAAPPAAEEASEAAIDAPVSSPALEKEAEAPSAAAAAVSSSTKKEEAGAPSSSSGAGASSSSEPSQTLSASKAEPAAAQKEAAKHAAVDPAADAFNPAPTPTTAASEKEEAAATDAAAKKLESPAAKPENLGQRVNKFFQRCRSMPLYALPRPFLWALGSLCGASLALGKAVLLRPPSSTHTFSKPRMVAPPQALHAQRKARHTTLHQPTLSAALRRLLE